MVIQSHNGASPFQGIVSSRSTPAKKKKKKPTANLTLALFYLTKPHWISFVRLEISLGYLAQLTTSDIGPRWIAAQKVTPFSLHECYLVQMTKEIINGPPFVGHIFITDFLASWD